MKPFYSFNPWAQLQARPPMGILGQDYAGAITRQIPSLPPRAPGEGTGVHLRQMYDPETPASPQTADPMRQFGTPIFNQPLGGRGMPTMMGSSPPLFLDDNRGGTPQSASDPSATPRQMTPSPRTPTFDVEDYLRRLYAAAGVSQ